MSREVYVRSDTRDALEILLETCEVFVMVSWVVAETLLGEAHVLVAQVEAFLEGLIEGLELGRQSAIFIRRFSISIRR